MKQLLDLYRDVLANGTLQSNRTGIDAISLPGAMMKFDLQQGFPAVTTKRLAFNAVKGELLGFLNGFESAADFRKFGCNIWDANANKNAEWLANPHRKGEDDLGRIYGSLWRSYPRSPDYWDSDIDQLAVAIDKIVNKPTDRRIIIDTWRPDLFPYMALPPCHVLYQFIVDAPNNTLHLCMYQRSCDLFLGVPFNQASCGLFLSLMAEVTRRRPGTFTHFMADAHIYVNHFDQVREQLSREPMRPARGVILHNVPSPITTCRTTQDRIKWLEALRPENISLDGYQSHGRIAAEMAV